MFLFMFLLNIVPSESFSGIFEKPSQGTLSFSYYSRSSGISQEVPSKVIPEVRSGISEETSEVIVEDFCWNFTRDL